MFTKLQEIATIVVCESDEPTLDLLCEHLSADHFDVLPAPSMDDALRLCRYNHPDLMLVSLQEAGGSGHELISRIRDADGIEERLDPHLPIIVLAPRAIVVDENLRVDDHVRKPFSYEELRTRIGAVLRRTHNRHDRPVRVGELVVDPSRRRVTVGEREVALAKKEFTLLRALASDPTRVFSKDELLRDVWGVKSFESKTRTLDSHASRLRNKLDPVGHRYVVNCWGIGYRLITG